MAGKIRKHVLMISTGQHVGKTTTSLGLLDVLQKKLRGSKGVLAYCKPVGQQHVPVDGIRVDKDAYLFKDFFGLTHDYADMSPVIFPSGFTRDFLDGKVTGNQLINQIKVAHQRLYDSSDFLVCEGTGHTGVGTICDVNNAQVASALNMDTICVTRGGLGSSFDELAMNREMLLKNNVELKGVIVNKVKPAKIDMITKYYAKALKRWNVPLIGVIPQLDELSHPSMADFSKLLKANIISGYDVRLRYFASVRLAVAPVDERNVFKPIPNQLIITHSNRDDVIDAMIHNQETFRREGKNLHPGLIITGWDPPKPEMVELFERHNIPCIHVPPTTCDSYTLTARISSFIAKLNRDDEHRLKVAIKHVSKHVNFDLIDV